jgi:hypothetical protein
MKRPNCRSDQNWPVEELHSGSQTPMGVLSSAGKFTGREKLVFALRLNEAERCGIEDAFRGQDACTMLVLPSDSAVSARVNRARQR